MNSSDKISFPEIYLNEDDRLLWKALKSGNKKALSKIYILYFHKLYNYGIRITNKPELIEDSIQDTFIEIWRSKERLGDVYSIKNYLFKSLRRRILLQLKKDRNKLEIDISNDLVSFDLELTHKSHFLNFQIDNERKQILTNLINTLSPRQKEAICLIFFDELSYNEAASIMSLKVRTIYNMVYRAIAILRENIDKLTIILMPLLYTFFNF